MTRPLQFIPFKSRADKGWAEAWELYEKSFPYNERWSEEALRPGFRRPEFRSRRHLARRGVHRHPLPLGCRRVPLCRAPGRLAALRGQNMGSATLSAFCRKGRARHPRNRPARRRHFDPPPAFLRAAGVRRQPLPVHPPVVPQALHAPPAGADELSRRHHLRRSPQFCGLRSGGSPPLFGARSPCAAETALNGHRPAHRRPAAAGGNGR